MVTELARIKVIVQPTVEDVVTETIADHELQSSLTFIANIWHWTHLEPAFALETEGHVAIDFDAAPGRRATLLIWGVVDGGRRQVATFLAAVPGCAFVFYVVVDSLGHGLILVVLAGYELRTFLRV